MAFDIDKIDVIKASEDGVWTEIFLPDGSVTDFQVKVRGRESAAVKKVNNAQAKSLQREANKAKRVNKDLEFDLDEFDKQAVELAIAATIDWKNLTSNGTPIEFSATKAREIYSKNKWLVKQVNAASENDALFL